MKPLDELPFVIMTRKDDFTQIFQLKKNGQPIDLTGATLSLCVPNADETSLTLALTTGLTVSGSPLLGMVQVDVSGAQSTLVALFERMDLDFVVTKGGKVETYRVQRALSTRDRSC